MNPFSRSRLQAVWDREHEELDDINNEFLQVQDIIQDRLELNQNIIDNSNEQLLSNFEKISLKQKERLRQLGVESDSDEGEDSVLKRQE